MSELRKRMVGNPDLTHNMMEALWDQWYEQEELFECEKYFTMDPLTYKMMQYSRDANTDGSLSYFERPMDLPLPGPGEAPLRWRDLKIMFKNIMAPLELSQLVGGADAEVHDIHQVPFCMYLTVVKPSGRLVYFTDEHTEPQYL